MDALEALIGQYFEGIERPFVHVQFVPFSLLFFWLDEALPLLLSFLESFL